jgi:hypothetical protein
MHNCKEVGTEMRRAPRPDDCGPAEVVSLFLQQWKQNRWDGATLSLVAPSWEDQHELSPLYTLECYFGFKDLQIFHAVEETTRGAIEGGRVRNFRVEVSYRLGPEIKTVILCPTVVLEPSPPENGEDRWFINPISALRERPVV